VNLHQIHFGNYFYYQRKGFIKPNLRCCIGSFSLLLNIVQFYKMPILGDPGVVSGDDAIFVGKRALLPLK